MSEKLHKDLMRLLHGELPAAEARALRERLSREPELAAAYRRLEGAWHGLEAPPPSAVPPGFAGRVLAWVEAEEARRSAADLGWLEAPAWVRGAAVAALAAGLALGVGIAWQGTAQENGLFLEAEAGLADDYWSALEIALEAKPSGEGRP